jgi:hypothetical protein
VKAFLTAIAASLLLPAAALAVVYLGDGIEQQLEPAEIAEAIPASPVEVVSDGEQHIAASLTWTPGPAVLSPRSGGTVQEVLLSPGSTLGTGTAVAVVDGVTMIGYVSPRPLYRALELGADGADVSIAEDLLVGLGHLASDRNRTRVDATLVQAIRRLNKAADRQSDVLDPDLLAWAGTEPFAVAKLLIKAGGQFPGLGEPIAEGPMKLAGMTLADEDGKPLALDDLSGQVLVVQEQDLTFEGASLDQPSEGRLAALLPDGPAQLNAVLRLAEPIRLVAVPAGAIVTDHDGGACVVSTDGRIVAVVVVDGEPGRAYIRPAADDAPVPGSLIANPHGARPGARCDS